MSTFFERFGSLGRQSPPPPPPPSETLKEIVKNAQPAAFAVSAVAAVVVLSAGANLGDCPALSGASYYFAGCLLFLSLIAGFCFFARPASPATVLKSILHPFSIKDLMEISLSSGTATISFYEIGLAYAYQLMMLLVAINSIIGLGIGLSEIGCFESGPFLYSSYMACLAILHVLYIGMTVSIWYYLPHSTAEHLKMMRTNAWEGIQYIWAQTGIPLQNKIKYMLGL